MSIQLTHLSHKLNFPDVETALDDPDGLLAFGGDLSPARLLLAYRNGIFPWFGEDEPIMWWSPSIRGILNLAEFHCSRSLAKLVRQQSYRVTLNADFNQVIQTCSGIPRTDNGTWITQSMIAAYQQLHRLGYAHSVEVWQQDQLVGGLYGVAVGKVFCGESMFHQQANCSKLAMYWLVEYLQSNRFDFIDCQMVTPHLATMGVKGVKRSEFVKRLHQSISRSQNLADDIWNPGILNG
ncbi:leucyl/phenylalanyl-tRNA--protein transferase [Neptunicella sp. SCSIO 80796]|uniref:leucyl/phenylalanyl-tRNA--protein transferase n=1 Tax=Neptunicella plasticusilytica TaxID=3117012 RepID=UPI003A4D4532